MAITVVPAPKQVDLGIGNILSLMQIKQEKQRIELMNVQQQALNAYRDKTISIAEQDLGMKSQEHGVTLESYRQIYTDDINELKREIVVARENGNLQKARELSTKYNSLKDFDTTEQQGYGLYKRKTKYSQEQMYAQRAQMAALSQQLDFAKFLNDQKKAEQDQYNKTFNYWNQAAGNNPVTAPIAKSIADTELAISKTNDKEERARLEDKATNLQTLLIETAQKEADRQNDMALKTKEQESKISEERSKTLGTAAKQTAYSYATMEKIVPSSLPEVEAEWANNRRRVEVRYLEPGTLPFGKPGISFGFGLRTGPAAGLYTYKDARDKGFTDKHWKDAGGTVPSEATVEEDIDISGYDIKEGEVAIKKDGKFVGVISSDQVEEAKKQGYGVIEY